MRTATYSIVGQNIISEWGVILGTVVEKTLLGNTFYLAQVDGSQGRAASPQEATLKALSREIPHVHWVRG